MASNHELSHGRGSGYALLAIRILYVNSAVSVARLLASLFTSASSGNISLRVVPEAARTEGHLYKRFWMLPWLALPNLTFSWDDVGLPCGAYKIPRKSIELRG